MILSLVLPESDRYCLQQARVPQAVLTDWSSLGQPDWEGNFLIDLEIDRGKICAIAPTQSSAGNVASLDLQGRQLWPGFVDIHTHIDKGHIWPRSPNPDGSFDGALTTAIADSQTHWNSDELLVRMEFSLRCAYAHGTVALRTHLDSAGDLAAQGFTVFQELRERWRDRLTLQAASLVSLDHYQGVAGERLADLVAAAGGLLGGVTFPSPALDEQLDRLLDLARDRQLDLDLHVDESLNPSDRTLLQVAAAVQRNGFTGKVLCGHCCSLSVQPEADLPIQLQAVQAAGLGIVSLPLCNSYLQDRQAGRTPRLRGIAPVQEIQAAGIPTFLSSDNSRDPFYAYGDLDMVEVFRESVRIGQLDHPGSPWPAAVTRTPADWIGLPDQGRIAIGARADFVIFNARSFTELLARPQSDRLIVRNGRAIAPELPDYAELDAILAQ
ncbi:cytosine deaminase [Synechococcus elongatus PCC 6301]|uniref:Cytosine deaminase n=1 Tax=Synechococcus sp. (strain ATCC 27144 / PCC 6301 / SAUG 1402/1) TaxID=269084 RepID=A0A0H3K1L1_SYNP6|nr:cytosine deaminase [Synechococcus elongatus]BAD79144.1 cytosine deaminase [Synechococcus elongatus PCC 6301]